MRVALQAKNFTLWGGGQHFLYLIAAGLLAIGSEPGLELWMLLPKDNLVQTPWDAFRVVKRSLSSTKRLGRLVIEKPKKAYQDSFLEYISDLSDGIKFIHYNNTADGLLRCLRGIGADIIMPLVEPLEPDYPVPWVGYIWDFQHKYYPDYFHERERSRRDKQFASATSDAKAILVNSLAVKEDVGRFYPQARARTVALPFSPIARPAWFETYNSDVGEKYDLPVRYFLVSNQFWVHKDHMTAFKALKEVAGSEDVSIVCTGDISDCRHPEYADLVRRFIGSSGLEKRVRLLGYIPKREQVEVMKGAIAVIQPTLFEGGPGGGSVYDAVSLGVPVILSDIKVNREVEGKNVWWFEAGSPADLAKKMEDVIAAEPERPTVDSLKRDAQFKVKILGEAILSSFGAAFENR